MRWFGRIGLVGVALVAAQGCGLGPNVSSSLPLTRVVVYRNGVGYFERAGKVDEPEVKFKMRQRMVGDFLATLAIVERGGSSVRSASFPLLIDDEPVAPSPLLAEHASLLKPLQPPPEPPKLDENSLREVTLSLDGQEHELAIGYVAETPVWRPSYRLVVRSDGAAELQAWGIVQNLSGEDWEGVRLALVAGAPLAFESRLGDPVVPPRPVVTDSGEVIASMPTGMTSLEQREGGAIDRVGGASAADAAPAEDGADQDELAEAEAMAPATSTGRATKPTDKRARGGGASVMPAAPAPAPKRAAISVQQADGPSAPRRMSALAAVAVDTGSTRYELPTPVTVPDESATMVLLTSQQVPGKLVFLFAPDGGVPDSASHPFRVARFSNATKGLLERGPIAVFEKGSFLGQGLMEPVPKGAKATIPFALERSLGVQSTRQYEEAGARLARLEAGTITIERDSVSKTRYTVANGGEQPAQVLVRHARSSGARLYKPAPGTEDDVATGFALVPVDVRPGGKTELTVDERSSSSRVVDWTSTLADEAVRGYLADPRANRALVKGLEEAWQLRAGLVKAMDEASALGEEQRELERMTRETRLSLQAIEKNTQAADLRAKLTRRLAEGTARLEQITKRMVELNMAISEQQVRFRDAVRDLKLTEPLPPRD